MKVRRFRRELALIICFPRRNLCRALCAFKRSGLLLSLAVLGDLAMILGGLLLGYWIRFHSGWIRFGVEPQGLVLRDYRGLMGAGAALLLLTFAYLKLYDSRAFPRTREARLILFKGTTFWFFAFLSLTWVTKIQPVSRIYLFTSYGTCLAALLVWRWIYYSLLRHPALAQAFRQRMLFVGWNEKADSINNLVAQDPTNPYEVVGWIPAPLGRRDFVSPRAVHELGDCSHLAGNFEAPPGRCGRAGRPRFVLRGNCRPGQRL